MTQADGSANRRVIAGRILAAVVLLAIVISVRWLVVRGRPSMEASQIQDCRTMYAAALSHADTLGVDYHLFPGTNPGGRTGSGGPAINSCGSQCRR